MWQVRITDEFFQQGDLERLKGMDVTLTCDRHRQSRVEIQKGFIDFVAFPFFALMAELLDFVASECPTILVHKTSAPDFDAEVAFPPGPTEAQVNKSALNIASRYLSEGKTW